MYAKPIVDALKPSLKQEVLNLKKQGILPHLACIWANHDPLSRRYLTLKQQDCEEIGASCTIHEVEADSVVDHVEKLGNASNVHGVLIQLPVEADMEQVFEALPPNKDVDGLTAYNMGKLFRREYTQSSLLPCTAKGILRLLQHYQVPLRGRKAVVVGRSTLVGSPTRHILEDQGCTVTCLHTASPSTQPLNEADIVVCAVGKPESFMLKGNMIKEGATVVGVGVRSNGFDVDFDSCQPKCSYITPNIGGVGLMTRLMLMENLIIAARNQL